MYAPTQDGLDDYQQLLNSEPNSNEGTSILEQELSDSSGFPSCYLFKDFWIELNPIRDQNRLSQNNKKTWEALIHSNSYSQTVIAVGVYSTRLEAALKAEQIIQKWSSKS